MFGILFLIIILYVIHSDAHTLREEDDQAYRESISQPPLFWVFVAFLFAAAALPIYLLRRRRYFRIHQSPVGVPPEGNPLGESLQGSGSGGCAWGETQTISFASYAESTGLVLTACTLSIVFSLILTGLSHLFKGMANEMLKVTLNGIIFDFVAVFLLLNVVARKNLWGFIGFKVRGKYFSNVLFPLVFGVAIGAVVFVALSKIKAPSTPLSSVAHSGTPVSILLFMLSAVFLAPIVEEVCLRGYLYSFIEKSRGETAAFILVSLLFGLVHVEQSWGNWIGIAWYFGFLGFLMTWIRKRTGSVVPGVCIHFMYNLTLILLPIAGLLLTNPMGQYLLKRDKMPAEEQIVFLKKSIDAHPRTAGFYNELAWIYAENNRNLDEAMGLIEEALKMSPGDTAYIDTKAEILFKMGKYREAAELEEELSRAKPADAYLRKQVEKFRKAEEEGRRTLSQPTPVGK